MIQRDVREIKLVSWVDDIGSTRKILTAENVNICHVETRGRGRAYEVRPYDVDCPSMIGLEWWKDGVKVAIIVCIYNHQTTTWKETTTYVPDV